METTDLERGSPTSTAAQSLSSCSVLLKPGSVCLCLILSSCLINVTLIYKCSFELLGKKNFQYSPILQNGNFDYGQIWLSVFGLLTLSLFLHVLFK